MPLTEKGQEILAAMKKQYGAERGEQVFYASKNAGKIKGVDNLGETVTGSPNITNPTGDEGDLVLDAESEEIVGDIPKEKVEAPDHPDRLPDEVLRVPVPTFNAVPATQLTKPLSIPVGDQSLSNMNARNRNYWRR